MAAALVVAACGGDSDSSDAGAGSEAGEPLPAIDPGDEPATETEAAASSAAYVDLVGPDVLPAAEIETNVLPSVVVDDLNNGRKVNFRNLVPQDKPVLLWMWAPH